jgi:hypothetical protein
MSQAMAEMCSVYAVVMDPDINNVRQDGIWGQVEFPTLQGWNNQGRVDLIEAMNPDGTEFVRIWSRYPEADGEEGGEEGEPEKEDVVEQHGDEPEKEDVIEPPMFVRRNETAAACGSTDDDTLAAFDEGGVFEVLW